MISVNAAQKLIQESLRRLPFSQVAIEHAFGLSLSEDVFAQIDHPPFAQSNMDGYALRFEESQASLRVWGESAARASEIQRLQPGSAMRIFTGAPVPEGADTVLIQEHAELRGDLLFARDPNLRPGLFVRPQGSDIKKGDCALTRGTPLTPAALGFLAGLGFARVPVIAPPRVTILVTGDELAVAGAELRHGQVYESNSVTLRAALFEAAIEQVEIKQVGDDASQLEQAIRSALERCELLLLTGGVSVGEHDYVASALKSCGVDKRFHGVRQKPGKPLYFGIPKAGPTRAVFGLPGNPSSVLTCFYAYVLPALGALLDRSMGLESRQFTLQESLKKPAGLTQFLKAQITPDGKLRALGAQESYRMSSFALSDALLIFEEDRTELSQGETVRALLLPHLRGQK